VVGDLGTVGLAGPVVLVDHVLEAVVEVVGLPVGLAVGVALAAGDVLEAAVLRVELADHRFLGGVLFRGGVGEGFCWAGRVEEDGCWSPLMMTAAAAAAAAAL